MDKKIDGIPTQFGYEILRDHVLPSILGPHENEILYWAGKEIARKFPLLNTDELPHFFVKTGWGTLSLDKSTKNEAFYLLKGNLEYINLKDRSFHLESGFIAEQYQKINHLLTECFSEPITKKKITYIQFHVKWDLKMKL